MDLKTNQNNLQIISIYFETFFSFFSNQMLSASAGGITDLLCHPNTEPFVDEPFIVHTLIANAEQFKGPKVYPVGALTKKLKSENEDVVGSVVVDDYSIEESTDNCLDYFCIATK